MSGITVGQNSPVEYVFKMGRLSVDEVSTSGRTNESDSGGEGGSEQFMGFPGQLVSYPLGFYAFREFCKAKGVIGGKWGKCAEFAGRQFRGCTVAEGEEYFYLLADLETERRDRGIDESISLVYFDGDIRSDLSEGFLCYLSQLEYGLSLPLTNLAKGVMNTIGACPVQMNRNMWEVITIYVHLNDWWERGEKINGNCHQRDGEELLDLRFRSVKQSVKSIVERKKSLLDKVAEEETELELVLGELGLSSKKRVESKSIKVVKAQSTRSMTGVDEGYRQTSGEEFKLRLQGRAVQLNRTSQRAKWAKREKVAEGRSSSMDDLNEVEKRARLEILQGKEDTSQLVAHFVKGIWFGIEEQESELKMAKSELEKILALAKTDALKEVK
ncbi:hypothetical protein GIB67_012773 [Kingdonia uniflora]|uniref:Uncharacterized protein n=1 Tax=Kingdonia uniflora TaxID=39325 RepID=A0A7J7NFB2_9MAGN|nr:hypothetical protein GIB67_012773 [Kingdonia uniflora]